MKNFDPAEIEEFEPRLKKNSTNKAAIRFQLRLANPQYVKAAQSGKTEAVIKVASHARGHKIKNLIQYIGRTEEGRGEEEKIHLEDQDGLVYLGERDIENIYQDWRKTFDRAKPGSKRPPRHATHIVFSAGVENNSRNRDKVLAAARETAAQKFNHQGFDYLIGLHQDADHPHVHIVIKNKNRHPNGKKFWTNPAVLLDIRETYAQNLREQGLEHVATLRRDRPQEIEKAKQGKENLKLREGRFIKAIEKASTSPADFSYRKSLSRAIGQFRNELKINNSLSKERKNEIKKSLRILEKTLYIKEGNIQKGIETTIRKLGKDALLFRDTARELTNPTPQKPLRLDPKARTEKRQYLEARATQAIKLTRDTIKKSDLPREQKIVALKSIKDHEKGMKEKRMDSEISAIIEQIKTDIHVYERNVSDLTHPISGKKPQTFKEKRAQKKALEKQGKILEKRLKEARLKIKELSLSPEKKTEALKFLKEQGKALGNTLDKALGSGRGFGL